MNLRVETRNPREGVAVIGLSGEVDVYTSPRVKQEIVNLLNEGTVKMVVDLTGVEYLDSTGLGVLIGGLKRARERDGDLKLICDNVRILRIFEITGLTKIFDIYRSESEAVESL
ncbi:MAG: STAS domain-containing protein [Armatimonadota bacterium]